MYSFDWLVKRSKLAPNKIALVDLATNRKITYGMFNKRASAFANFLLDKLKLTAGDRIAILAYNSSDYMEVLYGCAKAGIILVCLNWRLSANELKFILRDSEPRALLFDTDFLNKVNELKELNFLKDYVTFSKSSSNNSYDYEEIIKSNSSRIIEMKPRKYEDIWYLLYTSGTTGNPNIWYGVL